MSGRALLLWLAALAAVVVAVFLTRPPKEDAAPGEDALLALETDAVISIELTNVHGSLALVREQDTGWRLSRPQPATADPREVTAFLQSLSTVRVSRELERPRGDLASYGLSPPEATLKVDLLSEEEGGARSIRLSLGGPSPISAGRYVLLGERLLLTEATLADALTRDPVGFRERRLLPVLPHQINRVRADGPATIELKRDDGRWRATKPWDDRVDPRKLQDLVRALADLELSEFEDAEVDLGPQPVSITVGVDGSEAPLSFRFAASEDAGGTRLACVDQAPRCGRLDVGPIRDLVANPSVYRDRDLAYFSTPDVITVRVAPAGGESFELRRDDGETGWRIESGGVETVADEDAVDRLLQGLRGLRVESFDVPRLPGKGVRSTFGLLGTGGELGILTITTPPQEFAESPFCFVESSWRPGRVFRVEAELIEEIPVNAASFALPPATAAP